MYTPQRTEYFKSCVSHTKANCKSGDYGVNRKKKKKTTPLHFEIEKPNETHKTPRPWNRSEISANE